MDGLGKKRASTVAAVEVQFSRGRSLANDFDSEDCSKSSLDPHGRPAVLVHHYLNKKTTTLEWSVSVEDYFKIRYGQECSGAVADLKSGERFSSYVITVYTYHMYKQYVLYCLYRRRFSLCF